VPKLFINGILWIKKKTLSYKVNIKAQYGRWYLNPRGLKADPGKSEKL
jgi:hypothetical protein